MEGKIWHKIGVLKICLHELLLEECVVTRVIFSVMRVFTGLWFNSYCDSHYFVYIITTGHYCTVCTRLHILTFGGEVMGETGNTTFLIIGGISHECILWHHT